MTNGSHTPEIREALERFVFDNAELERLEALLDHFNVFVAMGWTRQELRHSAFLRWLLDPGETHGQGDYWLRAFLKRVARLTRDQPNAPSVVEIDSWDLSRARIHTEWRSIDLLVSDDVNRFVAVIENKVLTVEHSEQLQRYRKDVEAHFPEYRRLYIYLTPGEEQPSDASYVNFRYKEVVTLLDETLRRRRDQLGTHVLSFIEQYVEMVRRHIMEESEVQRLCDAIYRKHRRALDTLFEYRPNRASEVMGVLVSAVQARPELDLDDSITSYVRFIPKSLDFIPRVGNGWTSTKRMLLFEFSNSGAKTVSLKVELGPGDAAIRGQLHSAIAKHPDAFNRAEATLYPKFWACHSEKVISPKEYEELDTDSLREKIDDFLDRLTRIHLPKIETALQPLAVEWKAGPPLTSTVGEAH